MGWNINCLKNDLPITPEMARELNALEKSIGISVDETEGRIYFNMDHMEHMDYMWRSEVNEILLRHKANGEVCFNSADGDDAGCNWGYRYTDGVLTRLTGVVHWVPVDMAQAG
jgi:hypothetical protein